MAKRMSDENTTVPIQDFVITEIDETQLAPRGRTSKYKFDKIEVGNGFYFPMEQLKAIQAAASNYASTHKGYRFSVRKVDENRGVVIRRQLEERVAA